MPQIKKDIVAPQPEPRVQAKGKIGSQEGKLKPKPKPIISEDEPLTEKEEWVCREFVTDNGENQTRAYMRAYKSSSYDCAKTEANRLFTKPYIKRRIEELRAERSKRLEISADKVLTEMAKLSFYDPRAFFDADGRLKPIDEIDPDQAAVLAGIDVTTKIVGEEKDGIVMLTKIKLPDKGANLERLAKHLGLFERDNRQKTDPLTELIKQLGGTSLPLKP